MTPLIASVVLEVSIHKALDYVIPQELVSHVKRGVCVEVPLRGKTCRGFVVEVKTESAVTNLLPIERVISSGPLLTEDLFMLALFIAKYYVCPLGRVIKTMLPAGVRKNTQLKEQYSVVRILSKEELRSHCIDLLTKAPQQAAILEVMLQVKKDILLSELLEKANAQASSVKSLVEKGLLLLDRVRASNSLLQGEEYFTTKPKTLREEQKQALHAISSSLDSGKFQCHLLFGVTGSGKTEVYLQAIEKALQLKKGVIMLVPEISLTEQTIHRFKSRFSEHIAVIHHRISDGEKREAWENILEGKAPIVIGARSAVFCPMPNLGLIIVDEEHEQSYKSEESPCYNAKDVAIMRAKFANATCVLGSATPSLETYHNALSGKYTLSKLTNRGENQTLAQVRLVDMKHEIEKAKRFTLFSDLLLSNLEKRKAKGEQAILFLNRRGYHTVLLCQSCMQPIKCPHCDVKLAFHKSELYISCHLCGLKAKPPHNCPSCKAESMIKYSGIGTEKVEAMLRGIFPNLRTMRVDADTTRHKGSLERMLQEFRSGKVDVLIGTQMIAKGLHFPEVTLVGVLNADSTLHIPDFRAQESVFQLITQGAGRAGRGFSPGEVIIQTGLPEHSTIQHAMRQDYEAFFQEELAIRKAFHFPPFCRMAKFVFSAKEESKALEFATQYAELLHSHLSQDYLCHPVVPSGHTKVKDYFRFQFLIRGPSIVPICAAIEKTEKTLRVPSTIIRSIDVDPTSTFF